MCVCVWSPRSRYDLRSVNSHVDGSVGVGGGGDGLGNAMPSAMLRSAAVGRCAHTLVPATTRARGDENLLFPGRRRGRA